MVAAFLLALAVLRAPGTAGVAALIGGPIIYGLFQLRTPNIHFLIQVLLTFLIVCEMMIGITIAAPLLEPKQLPIREDMHVRNSRLAMALGGVVIAAVLTFHAVFW